MRTHGLVTLSLLFALPLAAENPKSLPIVDLGNISTAMQTFYIDSSRLTTVENLDDSTTGTPLKPWQAINDGGGALTVLPHEGFPRRQVIASWQGPYLSLNGARRYETTDDDYDLGAPFDLNGDSPIYFYTPLGLLDPKVGEVTTRYYGDRLGDYALVSHGPNGRYDGNLTSSSPGDDYGITIPGFTITIPVVSSANLLPVDSKGTTAFAMEVRGYNLGAAQGTGDVLVGGVASGGTILLWSPTRIEVSVPVLPAEGAAVTVRLNGGATAARSAAFSLTIPGSAIDDWAAYQ